MTEDGISFILVMVALTLTIMGYTLKRPALGFAASGFWVIFALFSYSLSTAVWDIYFGIFWISIAIAIICLLYTSPSPRDRQRSRMPSSA